MKASALTLLLTVVSFMTGFSLPAKDCPTPSALETDQLDETSFTLRWGAVDGVSSYRVEIENADGNPHYFEREVTVNAAEYVIGGLISGQPYKFKVRSVCSDDKSDWSLWHRFVGNGNGNPANPPANGSCTVPAGLTVSVDGTSAIVSWSAVDGAEAYEVEVEDGENTAPFTYNEITNMTTVTVSGLAANGQYKAKVKSKCSGGANSDYSDWVFFNAGQSSTGGDDSNPANPPASGSCTVPAGLTVSVDGTSATVSWSPVDGAEAYEVEVEDGENTAPFTFNEITNMTTVTVSGLAANGQYKAKVKSKCSGGANSDYSDWVFFNAGQSSTGGDDSNPANPPASGSCTVPAGLTVSVDGTSATVSWLAVDGAEAYEVEVEDGENTAPFTFNEITNMTTVTVSGLAANGQYKAKVKSKCSGGANSDYSDWVFFNAGQSSTGGDDSNPANPPASGSCTVPAGLTVSVDGTSATVSWSPVDGAEAYEVEVEDGENTAPFTFNEITNMTTVTVSGLAANGQYKAKVKSKCSGGANSDYSEWVFFNAGQSSTGGDDSNPANPPASGSCVTPQWLNAVVTGNHALLTWEPAEGALRYEVEVENGENTPIYEFKAITLDTAIMVIGLQPNGQYKFKVKSKCTEDQSSEYSMWFFFSGANNGQGDDGGNNTACAVPADLQVSELTPTSVRLSWSAVTGVQQYEVEVEDNENTAPFEYKIITAGTAVMIIDLQPGSNYQFKVKSHCPGGQSSDYSDWVFFSTPVAAVVAPDQFVDNITNPVINGQIGIYPNPAREQFYLSLDEQLLSEPVNIRIIDMNGRQVWSKANYQAEAPVLQIPVAGFVNGMYTVVIRSGAQEVNHKLVVAHD